MRFICSLTARHYPCFPSGPSLHWPLLAAYGTASSRGVGEPGTGAEMPNTILTVPTY